jgi:2-C-methyl-D-erythritol 4-phosphate cytidylyltransferase
LDKYAVILAAGKGSRMQSETPKQFLLLRGKPLIYYSIQSFAAAFSEIKLIIVLPPDQLEKTSGMVQELFPDIDFVFTGGGDTRFHSVKNGLSVIPKGKEAVVLVHDAARCLISPELIRNCAIAAEKNGSAIPAIPCSDSIRWVEENGNHPLDRSKVRLVQTPQAFSSGLILPAFQADYLPSFTDEATVVEHMGEVVKLIDGDPRNIKVTQPEDLLLAETFLA